MTAIVHELNEIEWKGHPARPEGYPARPEGQPARQKAQLARPKGQLTKSNSQRASQAKLGFKGLLSRLVKQVVY